MFFATEDPDSEEVVRAGGLVSRELCHCWNRDDRLAVSPWRTEGESMTGRGSGVSVLLSGDNIVVSLARREVGERWESVERGGYRSGETMVENYGVGNGAVEQGIRNGLTHRKVPRKSLLWGHSVAIKCSKGGWVSCVRVIAHRKSRRRTDLLEERGNRTEGRAHGSGLSPKNNFQEWWRRVEEIG